MCLFSGVTLSEVGYEGEVASDVGSVGEGLFWMGDVRGECSRE